MYKLVEKRALLCGPRRESICLQIFQMQLRCFVCVHSRVSTHCNESEHKKVVIYLSNKLNWTIESNWNTIKNSRSLFKHSNGNWVGDAVPLPMQVGDGEESFERNLLPLIEKSSQIRHHWYSLFTLSTTYVADSGPRQLLIIANCTKSSVYVFSKRNKNSFQPHCPWLNCDALASCSWSN